MKFVAHIEAGSRGDTGDLRFVPQSNPQDLTSYECDPGIVTDFGMKEECISRCQEILTAFPAEVLLSTGFSVISVFHDVSSTTVRTAFDRTFKILGILRLTGYYVLEQTVNILMYQLYFYGSILYKRVKTIEDFSGLLVTIDIPFRNVQFTHRNDLSVFILIDA